MILVTNISLKLAHKKLMVIIFYKFRYVTSPRKQIMLLCSINILSTSQTLQDLKSEKKKKFMFH